VGSFIAMDGKEEYKTLPLLALNYINVFVIL
jgi:hypothetical protein